MNRLNIIAVMTASLIIGFSLAVGGATGQQTAHSSDVEDVNAASQVFIAAISARDVGMMDKVWAHEPYATRSGCRDAIRTLNSRLPRRRTTRLPRNPVPPNTVTVRPFVAAMTQIRQFMSELLAAAG